MGWNPVKEAEKAARKAVDKIINPAVNAAKNAINGFLNDAKRGIYEAKDASKREIEGTANRVKGEVEQGVQRIPGEVEKAITKELPKQLENAIAKELPKQLEKAVTKELPKLIEQVITDLSSEAIKPALKAQAKIAQAFASGMDKVAEKRPDLVKEIEKVGFDVDLKVNVSLKLTYVSFWTRAREVAGILDRFGNDGIALRQRDIIGFMRAAGPNQIAFGGEVGISLGVVASGSAKAKALSLDLFIELAKFVMDEMGVPE